MLNHYGPPNSETWQILDRSDERGPWYLVRDRDYCGHSPLYTGDLAWALRCWHRRSVS
jgi:hypothetical protein